MERAELTWEKVRLDFSINSSIPRVEPSFNTVSMPFSSLDKLSDIKKSGNCPSCLEVDSLLALKLRQGKIFAWIKKCKISKFKR